MKRACFCVLVLGVSTPSIFRSQSAGQKNAEWKSYRKVLFFVKVREGAGMERVFDILQRIQQLWKELEQTKQKTREYEALMEKSRILSSEYLVLIDTPKNPRNSK